MTFTALFVGDIGFGEAYAHRPKAAGLRELLERGDYSCFTSELRHLLASADVAIGNLEVPLHPTLDMTLEGRKKYLGWSDPARTADALHRAGLDAVSLANNHLLDCGANGLSATLAHLGEKGIDGFGAGPRRSAADRPFIRRFTVGQQERTLIVFGRFEFRPRYQRRYRWYAGRETPGVSRLDIGRIHKAIRQLRRDYPAPFFVVYPHWGDDYKDVNPQQREDAKALIAVGADAVIGHGAHLAQGMEMIQGRPVIYGIGNFVWNAPGRYVQNQAKPYSLAVALRFPSGDRGYAIRVYPIVTDNQLTGFQSRPVGASEFEEAKGAVSSGLGAEVQEGVDQVGHYLEIKVEQEGQAKLDDMGPRLEAGPTVPAGDTRTGQGLTLTSEAEA